MIDLHILGTSASIPSRTRNLPAILINFRGRRLLFDCGEGTQKTIMSLKLGLLKIDQVFITHWHADHYAGLLGLIQTMSLENRKRPLYVYGPVHSKKFMKNLLTLGYFNRDYEVLVKEMGDGDKVSGKVKGKNYFVRAFEVKHYIPALGFTFEEESSFKADRNKMKALGLKPSPLIGRLKNGESVNFRGNKIMPEEIIKKVRGRKITYTGDTEYTEHIVEFAKDSDVLIHDSTFSKELIEKKGMYAHASAEEAAQIAKKAGVKKLVLTHISRRYETDTKPLLEEAQAVFKNTVVAVDGVHIQVKPYRPEKVEDSKA